MAYWQPPPAAMQQAPSMMAGVGSMGALGGSVQFSPSPSANTRPPVVGQSDDTFYRLFDRMLATAPAGGLDSPVRQTSASMLLSPSQKPRTNQVAAAYVADPSDLLDQHVAYQLRQNPSAAAFISMQRKQPGRYTLNGRDISVEWKHADAAGGQGHLVCVDGSTKQPFSEYIKKQPGPQQPQQARRQQSMPPSAQTAGASSQQHLPPHLRSPQLNGRGPSLATGSSHVQLQPRSYVEDKQDPLDAHVAYYLRHNQDIHAKVPVVRKCPGYYDIAGREVKVEWQHGNQAGQGQLLAVDGPLRQPFADYMRKSEANVEYCSNGLDSGAIHGIPQERRLTFGDQQHIYSRLDAMKVAKTQAQYREKAADYVQQGVDVPGDLMDRYQRTVSQKLGQARNFKRPTRPGREQNGATAPQVAAPQIAIAQPVAPQTAQSPGRARPQSPGRGPEASVGVRTLENMPGIAWRPPPGSPMPSASRRGASPGPGFGSPASPYTGNALSPQRAAAGYGSVYPMPAMPAGPASGGSPMFVPPSRDPSGSSVNLLLQGAAAKAGAVPHWDLKAPATWAQPAPVAGVPPGVVGSYVAPRYR
eukprot:TRINITY_DN37941_c0_g1_i1.p1 TRINITY_DN37941_c0_g1~~TRINITY_DN37941_c0_g1_i1.p1  ORF type:complete len:586 (-),score=67.13 TRINITY_DN37941_c0_g1_i1:65-1822(-)